MKTAISFMSKKYSAIITLALTALLTAGCGGYRLGSSLPDGISTIYIPTFVNKTSEPLLESVTTAATMSEIQRDGTLRLGDKNNSDIILYVSLTNLKLEPLRYENDNNTTTKEYRLAITASLRLENRATGKIMTRNVVVGEKDFIPTGDLSSGKRSALPLASRDLAHRIVEKVVEYW
jgi:hypothetical protein